MMQIVADPEDAAFAMHVARESGFNGGILERGGENLTGSCAHTSELLQAIGSDLRHVGKL